jgi:hypothetical protein
MATSTYGYCVQCVASRPCTYVRTPVPPWTIIGTPIATTAWAVGIGTTKSAPVDGWTKFTGGAAFTSAAFTVSLSLPPGNVIDWWFTARSGFARDMEEFPLYQTELVANPNRTFYPEQQRYHFRFTVGAPVAIRLGTLQQLGLPESFEVADDMTYTMTPPPLAQSVPEPEPASTVPASPSYAAEHRQTRGVRGRFVHR